MTILYDIFGCPAGGGGGGGVTSFKGRAGVVVPLVDDYSASQVTNAIQMFTTLDTADNTATPPTEVTDDIYLLNDKTTAFTGDTVISTTTISNIDIDATTDLFIGQAITGSGIPVGAVIDTITDANTIDIDLNSTATASTVSLTGGINDSWDGADVNDLVKFNGVTWDVIIDFSATSDGIVEVFDSTKKVQLSKINDTWAIIGSENVFDEYSVNYGLVGEDIFNTLGPTVAVAMSLGTFSAATTTNYAKFTNSTSESGAGGLITYSSSTGIVTLQELPEGYYYECMGQLNGQEVDTGTIYLTMSCIFKNITDAVDFGIRGVQHCSNYSSTAGAGTSNAYGIIEVPKAGGVKTIALRLTTTEANFDKALFSSFMRIVVRKKY